jgi:ParB-like chromosome segregation protein Spo0J
MRVIDGMHRLLAASLRGQKTIEVEFFDGTTEEAFLRAVEANVAHGLPLSQEDRRAATRRIIVSHPQMSDRAIARASGLSAKSVAAIRQKFASAAPPLKARIGIDGKARPVDSADGRRRAAELIAEFPLASLRDVARRAGISPATVSDVRKRLASGVTPIPDGGVSRDDRSNEYRGRAAAPMHHVNGFGVRKVRDKPQSVFSVLEKLLGDPSLRMREDGRKLLRLLQRGAVERENVLELTNAVPSHCSEVVADLVRQYAEIWSTFAQELDECVRSTGTDACM